MEEDRNYRFRCPICGITVWQYRLMNDYPLVCWDVKSNGRSRIKNIRIPWYNAPIGIRALFKNKFLSILRSLLSIGIVAIADIQQVLCEFEKEVKYQPIMVYSADVVYHPKLILNENFRR